MFVGRALIASLFLLLAKRKKRDVLSKDLPEFDGGLVPEIPDLSNVYLTPNPGAALRVVGHSDSSQNLQRLAEELEVYDVECLQIQGHLITHRLSGQLNSISVLGQNLVLCRVAKVDQPVVGEGS